MRKDVFANRKFVVYGFFIFIGIGFGFVLERSGFGRSDNLTSVFYGRDFRVLRVMFAAILTTMIGLYFLDLVGIMPISNIGLSTTYVLPAIIGGLVFGAGFVIGGYCPGTLVVSLGEGSLDALVGIIGGLLGGLVFTLLLPSIHTILGPDLGKISLHSLTGELPILFYILLFVIGILFIYFAFFINKIEKGKNMNIWKIATRWSDKGDPNSSIIDIFRKYNI